MLTLLKNRDYYGVSLALLLFVMVVFQKMLSPAIGVFIIVFFVELFIRKNLKFKFSLPLLGWVLLFAIYGLSLFKATHTDIGLKLLEYKMSFFIFPIIFSFQHKQFQFWKVMQGFMFGALVLVLALTFIYIFSGESYAYISSYYFNIHPTYSSVYITVALFILFYGIYTKNYQIHFVLFIILFLCSVFTLFALISFAGVLFFVLSTLIIFLFIIKNQFGVKAALLSLIVGATAVFFIITKNDRLSYDYATAKQTLSQVYEQPEGFVQRNENATSGTKIRVLMWYFSWEVIKENPMGVGLGDIDFYLDEKVEKYNISYLKTVHLNPHNQFLQIGIDTGVFGLTYFVGLFMMLLWFSIKTKNYLLLFLLFNLLFNSLFESMLQRQSGIVFYTLFACLLSVYIPQKKLNSSSS